MTSLRTPIFSAASLDAFGRQRVSSPVLLLEAKQIGGTGGLLATTKVTGSGATTYQINRASTYLTVGSAVGTAVRQSKSRGIYQAAKSYRHFTTGVMAAGQAGLLQSVGAFDAKNGVFFRKNGTTMQVVIRSFATGVAVEDAVNQSNWNVDPMNGTGPSGLTADFTKCQIFAVDLEWLGVGTVAVGLVINRALYYVHFFQHANIDTVVYMSNPNLPLRWEIEATAPITGTATLESICGSIDSEGGYDITGVTAAVDMGGTTRSVAAGALAEIIALRCQSSFVEFCTGFIQNVSILCSSASNFYWRLVYNPTETVAGSWTAVTGSVMERNVGRTVTAGTGTVIASGYGSSATNIVSAQERPVLTFGSDIDGVADVFSLQVGNLGAGAESFLGALTWREVF